MAVVVVVAVGAWPGIGQVVFASSAALTRALGAWPTLCREPVAAR